MNRARPAGSECGCGTGQVQARVNCPACGKPGATLKPVTPKHTLVKAARERLRPGQNHFFCENPTCEVAYYNDRDRSVFTVEDLNNRVTIKDDSPDTPLCYCFKVLKRQALEEVARTGTTNVFQNIQAKMKPGQSCFCEKANPRGDTCSKDILGWLAKQGLAADSGAERSERQGTACCKPASRPSSGGGCCG